MVLGPSDLSIGGNWIGNNWYGPPGSGGYCEGSTYHGVINEVCGGDQNWGHTDLEVWRLVQ